MASSPILQGLTLLLLHRVLADAHTAWVIVLARPSATPCPAGKACLSAHRGVVLGVEESEAEVLGNRSQRTLPAPCSPFTRTRLEDFHSQGHFFHPRPRATLRPLSDILGSRTPGAGALCARGIALTCNHIGKQPQAGLGRGPKAREGGKGTAAGRARDKKPAGVNSLCWGGCPGSRGSPRLACPGNRQIGACSLPFLVLFDACQLLAVHLGLGVWCFGARRRARTKTAESRASLENVTSPRTRAPL